MANEWQVQTDDKIAGPFTDSQLLKLITSGRVKSHDAVRRGENSLWMTANAASLLLAKPVKQEPLTRECPFCVETILAAAIKCKHCGEFVDGRERESSASPESRTWSPGTAAILSFLIPGLGQIYKGKIMLGMLLFPLTIAGYVAVVPGLILHIVAVADAYYTDIKPKSGWGFVVTIVCLFLTVVVIGYVWAQWMILALNKVANQ